MLDMHLRSYHNSLFRIQTFISCLYVDWCVFFCANRYSTTLIKVPIGISDTSTSIALYTLKVDYEVAQLRNAYGADLVQLVDDFTDGYCGLG